MDGRLLRPLPTSEPQFAAENRARLRAAGVFTVNLVGGMGSGKTSLIRSTLESLFPRLRLGVVTADPTAARDVPLLRRRARDVLQVDPGVGNPLGAAKFAAALRLLTLSNLDALLVENVDPLDGPAAADLGQDAAVVVFSAAAGDGQAFKNPDVIAAADVIVLNKVDLLSVVPFDLDGFRENVRRINPTATLIELSTLNGTGIRAWEDWLLTSAAQRGHATAP
jgi:hydrogenase nickel incorporation protein HypB